MELKEFLRKKGMPVTEFAKRCGLTSYRVYHILQGGSPTVKTAVLIEKFTGGQVPCFKTLPVLVQNEISEIEKSFEKWI